MKKKALLLAILLLVATVTSCASDGPVLKDFIRNMENETADLGGRTVLFGVSAITEDGLIPLQDSTSAMSDAQRKLIKNVEERLHCVVEQDVFDKDALAASIGSFNCKFDLLYDHTGNQIDLVKAGLLHDLNTFEVLDLSNVNKWGTAQDQLHRTYQGKVFGVKPRSAASTYTSLEGVMMVNDSLIKTFGQPTPKELFEQGNWTFDYFTDYVVKVSDMKADEPIYGMSYYNGQLSQLPLTAIFANGSSLLQNSNSGSLSFNLMKDPKAVAALDWAQEVYETGVLKEEDAATNSNTFISGRSSLWLGGAWVGTSNRPGYPLQEMSSGFSFFHMPYGPDAEYGKTYSSFIFVSRSLVVPVSSDEYEMGCFLNEFCAELSEEELDLLKYEAQTEYFFNEEDYNLLIDMADNAVYTYLYAELNDVRDKILTALDSITKGKTSISESIGAIEGRVSEELKKIK